jgi:hypothetical protein
MDGRIPYRKSSVDINLLFSGEFIKISECEMNFFTENIYWLYQQRSLPSPALSPFPFDISFMFRFFSLSRKSNFEKKITKQNLLRHDFNKFKKELRV